MMPRFFSVLMLVPLLIAGAAAAETFPKGDVFSPLLADPLEPRNFISVLRLDADPTETTLGSVGLGANFGLRRWPGLQPGDGWQLGVFAAFASQFDLKGDSYPLLNADYRVGFPLTYRRGTFSARARIFHQSSHLGDEFILQGNAPQRENLSVEIVDLVLAWDRAEWRPYVGGLYVVHRDPGDLKRGGLQVGVDYTGTQPVLFGGRLVGGVDVRAMEETSWRRGVSVKVGLEYGRPGPDRRGITVLLEGYDGPAPFGQFYRDNITSYGLGVQFNY